VTSLDSGLAAASALAFVLGAGLALGGVLGAWRYGHGLGEGWYRVLVFSRRWGIVAAACGLVLLALAAIVD
jgi:hypothetical protein